jgi:cation diffusion facilitator family transporter
MSSIRGETLKEGERAAKIGFLAVAVLGVVKGVVGWYTGSLSVKAQAVDSVTDLLSLVAVYIGIRLSQRAPSDSFPYGYYRVETLASLVVAILITATGGELLRESAVRVMSPEPISSALVAILVTASSMPVLYALSRYSRGVGERINSQSLLSQSADFRTDIYSSALVLVGVASSQLGLPLLDGVVGAMISLLVIRMGLSFAWNALLILLDAVAEPERMDQVRRTAEGVRGVLGVKSVRIRRSGPVCMGELTIEVATGLPVEEAHRLADEVESRVRGDMPQLESLIVHIEPRERSQMRIAIPITEDGGIESKTALLFGEAPYFIFVDVSGGEARRWATRPNPGLGLERKRGLTTSHLLIDEGATTLIAKQLGEGPYHVLRGAFIDMYELGGAETASQAVTAFIDGALVKIEEPKTDGKNESEHI